MPCLHSPFLASQPQFNNAAAMNEGSSDVFNSRTQRGRDAVAPQRLRVPAQGALAAMEESAGQVLQGEEPPLLQSFVAEANQAVAA
jgi:hypothetical protein